MLRAALDKKLCLDR